MLTKIWVGIFANKIMGENMKLYKRIISDNVKESDTYEFIDESSSVDELKKQAVYFARTLGVTEHAWTHGINSSGKDCPPYELEVNDSLYFVIREY